MGVCRDVTLELGDHLEVPTHPLQARQLRARQLTHPVKLFAHRGRKKQEVSCKVDTGDKEVSRAGKITRTDLQTAGCKQQTQASSADILARDIQGSAKHLSGLQLSCADIPLSRIQPAGVQTSKAANIQASDHYRHAERQLQISVDHPMSLRSEQHAASQGATSASHSETVQQLRNRVRMIERRNMEWREVVQGYSSMVDDLKVRAGMMASEEG